jgi:hypothetical protein
MQSLDLKNIDNNQLCDVESFLKNNKNQDVQDNLKVAEQLLYLQQKKYL